MIRSRLVPLLAALCLGAAPPDPTLGFQGNLGRDPRTLIQLVPPGCWRGLLLGGRITVLPATRDHGLPGATVEVLDFLPPEDARDQALARFRLDLRQQLDAAWRTPPPDHAREDLALFMATNPAHPETLDTSMVQSLQDRFNARRPEGMPPPSR